MFRSRLEHAAKVEGGVIPFDLKSLSARRRDDLYFEFACILERLEIGELDAGQRVRVSAGKRVFRVKFGVTCFGFGVVFMIVVIVLVSLGVIFVAVVLVIVLIMRIGVILVPMVVVVMVVMGFGMFFVVMVVVRVFAFERCAGLRDAAFRGGWEDEKIKWFGEDCDRAVNGRPIFSTFGGVFETHDICARRLEFHRHRIAVDGDIQCADTVLMGVELARFFGQGGAGKKGQGGRESVFHGKPFMTL